MRRIFLAVALLLVWAAAAWGALPPEIVLESARYTKTSQDVDFDAIVPYQKMLLTFTFNTNESVIFLDVNIVTGARRDASTITITAIGGLKHGAQFELMSLEEGSITLTARNITGESSTFTQTMKAIEGTPPEETEHINVELVPSEITLKVGERLRVVASGEPEIDIFYEGIWEIEDKTVATVDSDFPNFAYVEGHKNGTTTLKYTVRDRIQDIYGTATAKITVTNQTTVEPKAPVITLTSATYKDTKEDANLDAIVPNREISLIFDIEDNGREGEGIAINYNIQTPIFNRTGGYRIEEKPFRHEDSIFLGPSETGRIWIEVSNSLGKNTIFEKVIKAIAGTSTPNTPDTTPTPPTTSTPNTPTTNNNSGGGGGCNAGFLGLAALAAMAMKKR